MTKIIFYVTVVILLFVTKMEAQDTSHKGEQIEQNFENRVKLISSNIENITKEEKSALKTEVETVNVAFQNGKITKEEADKEKQKLAATRAKNIETRVEVEQEKLTKLVQEKADGKIVDLDTIKKPTQLILKWEKGDKGYTHKSKPEKRTTSQFVFALGLNNLVVNGNLKNSDYRFLGSHFYEWGFTENTRIFKNDNLLHLKYGFSVMYNNLRPTDNRNFIVSGNQTILQTNLKNLDDSRFRNVYLVLPLHLEFDLTKKEVIDDKTYFKTHKNIRLGIGGYVGINLKSKQIMVYEDNNQKITEKTKGDFNTNNFIYGLSTYIGYKETSLYLKYDLNTIFKDNLVKQNNVSLGIRFDLN